MKRQCESKQFISINDKVEIDARVFISNRRCGEESKTAERQKERECERDRAMLEERDSIGNKIDS